MPIPGVAATREVKTEDAVYAVEDLGEGLKARFVGDRHGGQSTTGASGLGKDW